MIAAPTSSIDTRAASSGVSPSFKRRSTFSTTTMASSTTMPTDRTRPNSVSMLSVKPNPCITTQVPISDTGMATTGMMRGAPGLEEQQHHQNDQDGGLDDAPVELGHRYLDELGRIVGEAVFEALGEALGHLHHGVLDALRGTHGVASGLLVDDDDDRRVAVGIALRRVAERAKLDAADVLEAHDAPIAADLDNDVLELIGIAQTPLHLQGDLEGIVVIDGRLAQRAARHLHVLGTQRL